MSNIVNNTKENRFEVLIDEYMAYLSYEISENIFLVRGVFVPDELGGKGLGRKLSVEAYDYANSKRYKIVSNCWFFSKFLEKVE